MIRDKRKKEKGISLVSLVVTIVVLVILTNIIIYNAKDNLKIGKLKEMQNDIGNLRDKISYFYVTNGKIPAKLVYNNEEAIEKIRVAGVISDKVDTGNFLVIDLSVLENVTLNRGQDYENLKNFATLTEEEAKQNTDVYIINETSHNIFYVAGITINNETFYTDYGAEEVEEVNVNLRYVDNVKIPEGFYYAGGSKEEGLVISDKLGDDLENSKQGNQFVWVPVENINDFKRVAGYYSGNQEEYDLTIYTEPYASGYNDEVSDYNTMKKSVEQNKGFYIGRFEAGKDSLENVVVKKGVNVYNNVPWGKSMSDISQGAVTLAKDFASNNGYQGVTSTLCYGVQWDVALKFIDSNYTGFAKDSSKQGWYSDNYSKTDTGNIEANPNHITGKDLIYADNLNIIANKQKNIYDMAGNVYEWTMEAYNTKYRVGRGGRYSIEGLRAPSSFHISYTPDTANDNTGFRITLYLNENEEENWSPKYDKEGTYKDKNGDTAYIPEGFQVSKKGGEDTINEGLVVRDANKNEFVWVPVNNMDNFKTASGYYKGDLFNYIAEDYIEPYKNASKDFIEVIDYNNMRESVKNNHGFYIGRYEAGKEANEVVMKKGATVYNYVPWGNTMTDIESTSNTGGKVGAVKLSKEFAIKNNYKGVTSTLCYGVQWDAVMQFMDDKYITDNCNVSSYVRDSSNRGHYNASAPTTAGSKEEYAEKNIYDMAGNLLEWTMEPWTTTSRVSRGGFYQRSGFDDPASDRSRTNPFDCPAYRGFRIALYLQD